MLLSMPGPSSSARGAPVDSIGSPRYSPEVSSYTWTNAVSPSSRMISPISFSLPTRTISYIRAPASNFARAGGSGTTTGRSRSRRIRARASSVPRSRSSLTMSSPYPAAAYSRISPSASSGAAASRTSTPARRKPVAVSLSVMTATLYTDELLAGEVDRHPQQLRVRDHAQVADLGGLAGEVADDDVERQRVAEVELGGPPQRRPVDRPLHLRELLRSFELGAEQ